MRRVLADFYDPEAVKALGDYHQTKDPGILTALADRWQKTGNPAHVFLRHWLKSPGSSFRVAPRPDPSEALGALNSVFPHLGNVPGAHGRGSNIRVVHFPRGNGLTLSTPTHSFAVTLPNVG